MANPHPEMFEMILRECSAARPNPWYPGDYAKATGLPREPLEASLDQLRINGLVQLTPWAQGHGQGYQITSHGIQVLEQPRALARLRHGEVPIAPPEQPEPSVERHALGGMRGEQVRAALLDDSRPVVTRLLMAANVAWFFVGMFIYINHHGGSAGEYLAVSLGGGGNNNLSLTFIDMGSLYPPFVTELNQWWRLLSCGFVHIGLIHLGLNMYALNMLGSLVERMWGRTVFAAIYLLSLVGCSAASLLFTDANAMGASGAICGLLGSMATWVFLNRSHLPPHIVSAWSRNIITNIILIGIISLLPGVSMAGHAGGGITGAVVSAPLNLARFGRGSRRFLGWAGAVAIAVVGLVLTYTEVMKRANAHSDPAGRAEIRAAEKKELAVLARADEGAREAYSLESAVFKAAKKRPDDEKAADIRKKLLTLQSKLESDIADLERGGPYQQADLAATMKTGIEFLKASAELSGKTAKVLEPESPWPPPDLNQLRADHARVQQLYEAFGEAWQGLSAFKRSG